MCGVFKKHFGTKNNEFLTFLLAWEENSTTTSEEICKHQQSWVRGQMAADFAFNQQQ